MVFHLQAMSLAVEQGDEVIALNSRSSSSSRVVVVVSVTDRKVPIKGAIKGEEKEREGEDEGKARDRCHLPLLLLLPRRPLRMPMVQHRVLEGGRREEREQEEILLRPQPQQSCRDFNSSKSTSLLLADD